MKQDIIERLNQALNSAMRPGTGDSDVNVYTYPVSVSMGDLSMAIAEIERLRAQIMLLTEASKFKEIMP